MTHYLRGHTFRGTDGKPYTYVKPGRRGSKEHGGGMHWVIDMTTGHMKAVGESLLRRAEEQK